MEKIIFATSNSGKMREIREIILLRMEKLLKRMR